MATPTARTKTANASDAEATKAHKTRPTRGTKDAPVLIVEELQPIKDAKAGRDFLEGKKLLVPVGMPLNTAMAAICLHHITAMAPGIPPTVTNAIRALAFLMEEVDTTAAIQNYHDGFNTELDNFTTELGQLVADARTKLDLQLEDMAQATTRITQTANDARTQPQSATNPQTINHTLTVTPEQPTYSQVLLQSPKELDPRMLARHNIRRRQVMLEGIEKESRFGKMGDTDMREEVNERLQELGGDKVRARAATKQRNGGVLLEMDSDYGAGWTRTQANIDKLCAAIGEQVTTKKRSYNLIAKFAPLTATLEHESFLDEVHEANNLDAGTISSMRWLKPLHRRTKGQVCGHIMLKVTDATEANRMIVLGIYVANKKITVEKCRVDPVRCLKCQGYNHFAKECIAKSDTCGHCGDQGHRTSNCTNTTKVRCISCNTDDHPSYFRECPTFLKKAADKNNITPENNLPFIQTEEAWTWNNKIDDRKRTPNYNPDHQQAPAIVYQQGNQKARYQQRQEYQDNQHTHNEEGYQQVWGEAATNPPFDSDS